VWSGPAALRSGPAGRPAKVTRDGYTAFAAQGGALIELANTLEYLLRRRAATARRSDDALVSG
jgi:hypothetical protein